MFSIRFQTIIGRDVLLPIEGTTFLEHDENGMNCVKAYRHGNWFLLEGTLDQVISTINEETQKMQRAQMEQARLMSIGLQPKVMR